MPKLNLQPRERRVLGIGAVVFVLVLIYMASSAPLRQYSRISRALETARAHIAEAKSIRDTIAAERAEAAALRQEMGRRQTVDLVTLINRHLSEMNLLQNNRGAYRRETTAADNKTFEQLSVNLTGVSMKEVTDFLHRVYSAGNIIVMHSAEITPAENGQGLVCRFVLLSPRA